MANQKDFAVNPSVSITRSMFRRPSQHKTSMKLGEITPIYCDEVLPGDTIKLRLASLIRMSTPFVPIMDNIFIDYYAFFVPNRLVWEHWKEFMGENTSGAGIYTGSEYTIPSKNANDFNYQMSLGCLGDHLGLPVGATDIDISVLAGRAYYLIYNEWFRDQNLIAPFAICIDDTGKILVDDSRDYSDGLLLASKFSDYFTRALPFAQKGGAVTLPLGSTAPVVTGPSDQRSRKGAIPLYWQDVSDGSIASGGSLCLSESRDGGKTVLDGFGSDQGDAIVPDNLYADLSNATASTINQLRFAFQYQKMLEKDAMYGTRYWEVLKGHFGISAPDASLQRPQLLGSYRQRVNIDQVLQTSESDNTALGTTGANSVTGGSDNLFTFSSVEHGHIMILAVARHDQTYGQGLARMFSRKKRTDFYFPVFANLGAQEIKNKEIYVSNDANDDKVFGYQEAWAEYRYKPSIVSGILRPSNANYAPWTLATRFGSLPTLGKTFIEQDRTALNDALITGNNGPDFICDFYFDEVAVRPMPMYSIPGLIDHH